MGVKVDREAHSAAGTARRHEPRAANGRCARSSTPPVTSSASADSPIARSSGSPSAPESRSAPSTLTSIPRRRCSRRWSATCPRRCATTSVRSSRGAAKRSTGSGGRSRHSSGSRATIATSTASSTRPSSSSRQFTANITKRRPPASPRASTAARDKGEISAELFGRGAEIFAWGNDGRQRVPRPPLRRMGRRRPAGVAEAMKSCLAHGPRPMNEAGARVRRSAISRSATDCAFITVIIRRQREAAAAVPPRTDPERPRLRRIRRALFAGAPSDRARLPGPRRAVTTTRFRRATWC